MTHERWRPVPAYRAFGIPAGLFEASTEGNVRKDGEPCTATPDKDGYLRVRHGRRWLPVHTLVALAWHGPPEVRHLGDGRQDNRPAKLAWGSRRQNEKDKQEAKKEKIHYVTVPSGPVTHG